MAFFGAGLNNIMIHPCVAHLYCKEFYAARDKIMTTFFDTSYCIRDISRLGAKRSEGIPKHAKQFWKQAGGVLLQ